MSETIRKENEFFTIKDYENFVPPNNEICELIDGQIVMQARPAIYHQLIMLNLAYQFKTALKGKNCKPIADAELKLNEDILVPDLMILCGCNGDEWLQQRVTTPPALVVEIISPSNTYDGITQKVMKYKSFGIKEIWVVSPESKILVAYNDNEIKILKDGKITLESIPDVSIEIDDIFEL